MSSRASGRSEAHLLARNPQVNTQAQSMLSQQVTTESSWCYFACLGYSQLPMNREIRALMETFSSREMDNKQKLISKVSGVLAGDQYCGKKK